MAYSREQVTNMCKEVHGDKYDYSITEGVKNKLCKIRYICRVHGVVEQVFNNHLQGKGCSKCSDKTKGLHLKFNKKNFTEKARKTHDDLEEYDFSELNLNDRDEDGKVEIICKKHGRFKISPMYFVKGGGCPHCHGKAEKSDEEVREELSKLHPELDFSNTKYSERDSKYRIKVVCPKHGEQLIRYYNLKNGQGCRICGKESAKNKNTITNKEFIKRGRKLYGDKYTYEHLDMKNRDENGRVTVTCKIHGDFQALPDFFYHGHACQKCQESRLERDIRTYLEENKIDYLYQCNKSKFEWLGLQSLDFYLPKYNTAIECQGIQHYTPSNFGSKKKTPDECLKETQERDERKRRLCAENGVKLLYYADYELDFPYEVYKDKEKMMKEISGEA